MTATPSDIATLAASELFRELPREALAVVHGRAFRRRVEKGETVLRQGDPTETLYSVVVGRLRVAQTSDAGQQVINRYLGPGEMVGYTVLLGGDSHPATVTAVEDSHLYGWSGSAIRQLAERYPQITQNAFAVIGARYQEMQIRLREQATENVERRIAHTILRLANQAGRRTTLGVEIAFPLSRQDLAEMTGTTLHTVSRTMSGWEERGIVMSGRRRVTVCRPHDLVMLVSGGS